MPPKTLKITLLNHTFRLPVTPEDEARLIEAAELIEARLSESKSRSNELKALSVALNLAYDYLLLLEKSQKTAKQVDKAVEEAMRQLAMDLDTPETREEV